MSCLRRSSVTDVVFPQEVKGKNDGQAKKPVQLAAPSAALSSVNELPVADDRSGSHSAQDAALIWSQGARNFESGSGSSRAELDEYERRGWGRCV